MDPAFLFPLASHAEPFEPAERLDSDPSKAGTREDGSNPTVRPRVQSFGLPFSPQRDASKRRVIGPRSQSASKFSGGIPSPPLRGGARAPPRASKRPSSPSESPTPGPSP